MANTEFTSKASRLRRWRSWVQGAFLLVWLDPLALRLHGICAPVFHCYSCPLATFACPIGVIANFSALRVVPLMALGTLVVVGGLFATMVCGWACPFGFLQDLAGRVPTPRFRLPAWTGYGRYAVLLGLVIAVPYFLTEESPLFICRLCPAGGLEAAGPAVASQVKAGGPVIWPSAVKIGIVVVFVVAMFFTWRPWCRVFCPLGAIYSLFSRFSLLYLRFSPERCDECGRCARECRYGVDPSRRASDPRCIRCLECTACDALTVRSVFARAEAPAEETVSPPAES